MDEFWVFGYGSLMWNPGFATHRRMPARLAGYHRSLCVYSHVHRGTAHKPGLVLGLDRGGFCEGVALAARVKDEEEILAYLRGRELVTRVYRELVLPVRLSSGENVSAITYVVDHAHEQYAGKLDLDHAAELVRGGHGQSGANRDYLLNTVDHLREMRINDAALETVAGLLKNEQPRPTRGDAR